MPLSSTEARLQASQDESLLLLLKYYVLHKESHLFRLFLCVFFNVSNEINPFKF